jgi:DNA modification methylase
MIYMNAQPAASQQTLFTWRGKHPPAPLPAPAVVLCETWPNVYDVQTDHPNKLFYGDNLAVLAHLLDAGHAGRVRLIYADPPYNSGAAWPRKVRLRTAKAVEAAPVVDHQTQYVDDWEDGDYLQFMYERLLLTRELLADDGSLWLHCDHRHAHHLRMILDEVFGVDNYLNTITWRSQTARGAKVNAFYFANSSHTIHIFARNRRTPPVWNQPRKRIVLSEREASAEFMRDEHGFFRTSDPGTYSFARLKELHAAGKLYAPYGGVVLIDEVNRRVTCSNGGNVGVKYYLTNLGAGQFAVERAVDNIWDDIPGLGTTPGEDVGYPTQKTEALLRRIIETATNTGDLVLDPFVGSGVSVVVAQKLGRSWLGCDINYGAVQTTRRRLQRMASNDGSGFALYTVASNVDSFVQSTWLEPCIHLTATYAPDVREIVVDVHDYVAPDAPPVEDWRALVESIDIDPTYDGRVFRACLADAPQKRTAQVKGSYRLSASVSPVCVAVRITDVWGRETIAVQRMDGR